MKLIIAGKEIYLCGKNIHFWEGGELLNTFIFRLMITEGLVPGVVHQAGSFDEVCEYIDKNIDDLLDKDFKIVLQRYFNREYDYEEWNKQEILDYMDLD